MGGFLIAEIQCDVYTGEKSFNHCRRPTFIEERSELGRIYQFLLQKQMLDSGKTTIPATLISYSQDRFIDLKSFCILQ